ncbi:MAG TPA: LLM class flavin-dependent oxidoreductase [Thermoleophilaceae bacterium]|jgi:probable F420-dependent oxidoreductase|nr:LLM class flavin-dependent oxidoreductase [Thermoleophilaceae bacterium]
MSATRGVTILRGGIETIAATAADAEKAGFDAVWTPEFYTRSAIVTLSQIAARTSRCRVGTSIAYATGRSPLILATEARSLDEVSGGRLVLGLGTGTRRMMQDWHGVDPDGPATRMEELVPLLRRLWRLHEGPVEHEGRFYRCRITPTAETTPGIRDEIPVYTAGVNPRMIQVAGRVADGLLGHPLFSRDYVDEVVRPAIVEGMRFADREDTRVELVGVLICAIADDPVQARREAAAQLAFYAAPKTYGPLLDASGFSAAGETIRAAFAERDFAAMTAAIPDPMIDAMAAAGTAADVRARLDEAAELFDHVVVYPPSFGLSEARCDELAAALVRELAPPLGVGRA